MHVVNVKWHFSFSVWLPSLSMKTSRSILVAANGTILFYFASLYSWFSNWNTLALAQCKFLAAFFFSVSKHKPWRRTRSSYNPLDLLCRSDCTHAWLCHICAWYSYVYKSVYPCISEQVSRFTTNPGSRNMLPQYHSMLSLFYSLVL